MASRLLWVSRLGSAKAARRFTDQSKSLYPPDAEPITPSPITPQNQLGIPTPSHQAKNTQAWEKRRGGRLPRSRGRIDSHVAMQGAHSALRVCVYNYNTQDTNFSHIMHALVWSYPVPSLFFDT